MKLRYFITIIRIYNIEVTPEQLITILTTATGGKQVNIVVTACEGENMHKAAHLLPKGTNSKMLTLSDKDKSTQVSDLRSNIVKEIYDILFANGKFSI